MVISVHMKNENMLTGSICYEESSYILPDKWTLGNLIDWIVHCKLENAEQVLMIKLEIN
jgi:hypothetical protein